MNPSDLPTPISVMVPFGMADLRVAALFKRGDYA
jgi:hypothetical protein